MVKKGAAGTSDWDPLRTALNASLEPDRGPGFRSRASTAALQRVPTCWLQRMKPRARLVPMAPAPGRRARGQLRDEVAIVRTAGAGRLRWGPARLPAERTAPGAARGGAKEKVSPGPVQPSWGIGPSGAGGCGGQHVREGRSEARRSRAAGSTAASGDPAAGGAGTGRPERNARITEERRPPRGAPLGNKLHQHSFERRKKSPCCFPGGCGRPALAPGEPGGRRPAPPPPPPPRLRVSLL